MIIDTDNYIDAGEAARILGIKRARMSQLCNANRFPGQVKIGHFWIIPRKAVDEFERETPGVKPKAEEQEQEQERLYPAFLDLDDNGDDDEDENSTVSPEFDLNDPKEIAIREKMQKLIKSPQWNTSQSL